MVEGSAGVYAQNDTQWTDWFRSILGLRYDRYRFDVDASIPENSGNVDVRHRVAEGCRWSSGRGTRPSTSSTPATASTATTRAA